jgi:hypothetical protein
VTRPIVTMPNSSLANDDAQFKGKGSFASGELEGSRWEGEHKGVCKSLKPPPQLRTRSTVVARLQTPQHAKSKLATPGLGSVKGKGTGSTVLFRAGPAGSCLGRARQGPVSGGPGWVLSRAGPAGSCLGRARLAGPGWQALPSPRGASDPRMPDCTRLQDE